MQGHERVNRCATASSQEPPDNDEECVELCHVCIVWMSCNLIRIYHVTFKKEIAREIRP